MTRVDIYFRVETKESKEESKPIDNSKEAAIEAEVQAARQRAVVPLEIRMKQFRDMLAEKDVSRLTLKAPRKKMHLKMSSAEVVLCK